MQEDPERKRLCKPIPLRAAHPANTARGPCAHILGGARLESPCAPHHRQMYDEPMCAVSRGSWPEPPCKRRRPAWSPTRGSFCQSKRACALCRAVRMVHRTEQANGRLQDAIPVTLRRSCAHINKRAPARALHVQVVDPVAPVYGMISYSREMRKSTRRPLRMSPPVWSLRLRLLPAARSLRRHAGRRRQPVLQGRVGVRPGRTAMRGPGMIATHRRGRGAILVAAAALAHLLVPRCDALAALRAGLPRTVALTVAVAVPARSKPHRDQ